MTDPYQEKIATPEGTPPYRIADSLRAGAFYWVKIQSLLGAGTMGFFSDDWQPARYTGRSGTTVGETWDVIGFESANSHHFVEVIEIGREVRFEPESDRSYRARLTNKVLEMNDLDSCALPIARGHALDAIGRAVNLPRLL
jgi:hypothetical protein